ncbi:tyrosine-protein phosphatase [Novosphingobium sp. FKTRR1]|uniref:tyrosine-protein phosphatase n=1 Tax=Novosphingobium sp. FKTRR1 TaxID=2879118 RepID=UPI001CF0C4CE|nr:tyrosine-protein phosphatase [Novosphingobium sp. FKTRR1]
MIDRVLSFSGIHNFRDYGGYRARSGALRTGKLWRSGHHAEATAQDLDAVHELGIGTVIDLRGDSERAAHPCQRHGAFEGEVLFHPGETASSGGRAFHEEAAERISSVDDARAIMVRLYQGMAYRPVLAGTYRLYLKALAERDQPSLLHCLAGKDRTGVGAALVHSLLGVHHDDIMEDYLLTNTAGNAEARIAALRAGMTGVGLSDGAMRVLTGVEAEYLDAAFAALRDSHGTVEAYAADVLGAGPDVVAALEQQLVA